jgi:hypothetical protein
MPKNFLASVASKSGTRARRRRSRQSRWPGSRNKRRRCVPSRPRCERWPHHLLPRPSPHRPTAPLQTHLGLAMGLPSPHRPTAPLQTHLGLAMGLPSPHRPTAPLQTHLGQAMALHSHRQATAPRPNQHRDTGLHSHRQATAPRRNQHRDTGLPSPHRPTALHRNQHRATGHPNHRWDRLARCRHRHRPWVHRRWAARRREWRRDQPRAGVVVACSGNSNKNSRTIRTPPRR